MGEPRKKHRFDPQSREEKIAKVKAWRESLGAAARKKQESLAAEKKEEAVANVQTAVDAVREFIGVKMPDETVFAGMLPNGRKLYALPQDANVAMDFNAASGYLQRINREKKFGHDDWRIPNKEELDLLYKNQEKGALKDTFNQHKDMWTIEGEYWSCTSGATAHPSLYVKSFSDGASGPNDVKLKCAVRLVRTQKIEEVA